MITIKTESITPEKAKQLLKTNVSNRPIKKGHVSYLERCMKNNEWQNNGETIKINY